MSVSHTGRVLVTGSTGWLGRHLIPALIKNNYDPIGLDVVEGKYTTLIGSICDRSFIEKIFKTYKFDAVIHAAALHKPDIIRYTEQAFIDTNITGTLNLLQASKTQNCKKFIFTSTTSLMISQDIRDEISDHAVWLDESYGPIIPRNIYGLTKYAAENLCRLHHKKYELDVVILRTSRFFPEEDDTISTISGPNLKANELLNRRASVQDIVAAHIQSLKIEKNSGFRLYIISAPTPFKKRDVFELKTDAATVIERYFPKASSLYNENKWVLPTQISRVYDGTLICRELGFKYQTDFHSVLDHIEKGWQHPIEHDPNYISPLAGN